MKEVTRKDFSIEPNATAAELDELLRTADSEIKKAIALHPNTSPETLIELCKYNPDDDSYINYFEYVLDNPVLSLIMLEHPDFLARLDIESYLFFNNSAKLPEFIINWAVNHSDYSIRSLIATNQYISINYLEKLAEDLNTQVRASVGENVCMSDKDFERLYNQKAIDRTVNCDRDRALKIIRQLAKDRDKNVRIVVARNTGTPISILERLSFDSDLQVLDAVAKNPQTPEAIIKSLFQKDLQSSSEYKPIAEYIAMNLSIPIDLMEICANSEHYWVLSLIADNPSTSQEILDKLAKNNDRIIRIQVANHPNTSPKTTEYLEREGISKDDIPF